MISASEAYIISDMKSCPNKFCHILPTLSNFESD